MGINARNLDYIFAENRRRYYPLVDDKVLTKKVAMEAGIAAPELYGVIEFQNQVKDLPKILAGRKSFAIKPAKGSGGGGIFVIHDVVQAGYRKSSGDIISESDMRYHINNILSGMYSMGGQGDKALIEACVQFDPLFDDITYKGVPDIRILVYLGVPVMAMLRLPTRASDGKANLHMGGIGVGIDMATGCTLEGIQKGRFTNTHPETGKALHNLQIPAWQEVLEIATKFYAITKMGYIGVDIVLDKKHGPMLLEANARPGIAIQVANQAGLLPRLEKIKKDVAGLQTEAEKVEYARKTFGTGAAAPLQNAVPLLS